VDEIKSNNVASFLRYSADYIKSFKEQTFVLCVKNSLLDNNSVSNVASDINLLSSLGISIIVIIDFSDEFHCLSYKKTSITDSDIKNITRANAKYLLDAVQKLSYGSIINSENKISPLVTYSNLIISKPKGIENGTLQDHQGEIRSIDTKTISNRLDSGEIVLISPLTFSSTNEALYLNIDLIISAISKKIFIDKLIFLNNNLDNIFSSDNELTYKELKSLRKKTNNKNSLIEINKILEFCVLEIPKIHIVPCNTDGAILIELFTKKGIGCIVTNNPLSNIRVADLKDVNSIIKIIEPHEKSGALVKRSRELIEIEINKFFVYTYDNFVIGTGFLNFFTEKNIIYAEIGCIAVHNEHQKNNIGKQLIAHLEKIASKKKAKSIFLLTTKSKSWFLNLGYKVSNIANLPATKIQLYNKKRNSIVLLKKL